MVLLEPEPDPVLQLERRDVLLRQLEAPGPVEHRELLGDRPVVAVVAELRPAECLGRGPPVADRDRPLDLLRHDRVVGDDDDRRPELLVDAGGGARTPRVDVPLSSSPVGSSARTTSGSLASATAIATRCCSPPRQPLRAVVEPVRQPDEPQQLGCPLAPALRRPSRIIGSSTFSTALRYGSRFRAVCCQTKPDDPAAVAGSLAPTDLR